MPKNKVNSPVFVYNDSHLSLKHHKCIMSKCNVLLLIKLCDLILYIPSTIFQLCSDGSSCVEPD